jgi:hypothetical protein
MAGLDPLKAGHDGVRHDALFHSLLFESASEVRVNADRI